MYRSFIPYLLFLLSSLSSPSSADQPAFYNDTKYDRGDYGIFVELEFQSTTLKAPQINFLKWGPECETDKHFFIAPRGMLVGPVGPAILDSRGHLVWHREDFGVAYGLNVQKYKGEDVLTFWSGDDMVVGHGQGYHYIFDNTYQQINKISAVGDGLLADLHEFHITPQNTALFTIYNKTRADMRYWRNDMPADGWVWDCLFQEVDIETNELLFQWRASDHFAFADCFHNPQPGIDGTEDNAFDWFHINSIDKDGAGNYLISARYSHALTYVSGATGATLWQLGGKHSSFRDLSGGRASDFKWQHDARWQHGGRAITLFDNAAYFVDNTSPARGVSLAVDTERMTVALLREFVHPAGYIAESQGSLQLLPNGNAFLGYGAAPVFAEFSADGRLLCDAAFGALHWKESGEFSPGAVMSYRAYKHAWTGRPAESPCVAFVDGRFYVTWNGDTETRTWRLQGSASPRLSSTWTELASFERQGFESVAILSTGTTAAQAHLAYRLTAVDGAGAVLGSWKVSSAGDVVPDQTRTLREQGAAAVQVLLIAFIGAIGGVLFARRRAPSSFEVNDADDPDPRRTTPVRKWSSV